MFQDTFPTAKDTQSGIHHLVGAQELCREGWDGSVLGRGFEAVCPFLRYPQDLGSHNPLGCDLPPFGGS